MPLHKHKFRGYIGLVSQLNAVFSFSVSFD